MELRLSVNFPIKIKQWLNDIRLDEKHSMNQFNLKFEVYFNKTSARYWFLKLTVESIHQDKTQCYKIMLRWQLFLRMNGRTVRKRLYDIHRVCSNLLFLFNFQLNSRLTRSTSNSFVLFSTWESWYTVSLGSSKISKSTKLQNER